MKEAFLIIINLFFLLTIYRPHFLKLHLSLLEEKISCDQIALLLWPTSLVFSDYKLFLLWFKSISSSVFPKSLFPGCRLSQTSHWHPLQTETLSNAAYGLPNVKFISWSKYLCVFIWDEIWCCFEYRESKQSSSHTAENICIKVEENCSFKSFSKFNGDQLKVTAVPRNSSIFLEHYSGHNWYGCSDICWLQLVFHFGSENWEEQLKKLFYLPSLQATDTASLFFASLARTSGT